jgi:branched-chain amino acid aminotransferase
MPQEQVCINGQLVPADQAGVSVFDAGFMQGVGLFETMRTYRGRVFRLERHLDRLVNSAAELGWTLIPDHEQMTESINAVLSAVGPHDLRVRLTVTTGSLRAAEAGAPELTTVVTASPGGKYPDAYYEQGVEVVISRFRQSRFDPLAGHKTTSYFGRLAALREAHGKGALEAIWLNDQAFVAEGAISNVFAVRDGRLVTPPLAAPILPGTTRATVIELATSIGVAIEETNLTAEQLKSSAEVFLTNSMMEIMPVTRIERGAIGDGRPGAITRRLAALYSECVARECRQ